MESKFKQRSGSKFGVDVLKRYNFDLDMRRQREFFGVEIHDKEEDQEKNYSIAPPTEENEAATYITAGASFSDTTIDLSGSTIGTGRDLIVKYRNLALQPEVDQAIEDIVNETIVAKEDDYAITLNLDGVPKESLKEVTGEKIKKEFEYILSLLQFKRYGHDIFKRWYIDGILNYHIVTDLSDTSKGVTDLRPISPFKIEKIKEIIEDVDPKTGAKLVVGSSEYFVFSAQGFTGQTSSNIGSASIDGIKLPVDAVAQASSGVLDTSKRVNLSYLHKALRIANQVRVAEDSVSIYRLARAPERRVFNVETGGMPKKFADQYVASIANKYRNKMTYDASTGTLKNQRDHNHMLEDIFLPSSNGKGTTVSSLSGGANLGEIDDVVMFQKRLYQALNVPVSRLDPDTGYVVGRAAEINRDELRFQKFVDKLRLKFSDLFFQILKVQCVLKKHLTPAEWDAIEEHIRFDYNRDNYFSELKEAEIMSSRLSMLSEIEPYVGKYFSDEYVRRHVLRQSEDEIEEIKKQIRAEHITNLGLPNPNEDTSEGGGRFDGGGDFEGGEGDFEGDFGDEFGEEPGEEFGEEPEIGEPEGSSTSLGINNTEDDDFDEEEFDEDE